MTTYTIRIEKTKIITKEVECETVGELTEISNALVKSLKETEPDATYWVDISKKRTGPSWMAQMPSKITDTLLEGTKVSIDASLLEKAITQRTHTKFLTVPQREKLMGQVWFIPADAMGAVGYYLPSPVQLYNDNTLFKKFADEKIKAMVSHGAPNSKIVNALCAYENPQGWLNYRDKNFTPEETKIEDKYIGENIGYSPNIKRI